MAYKFISIVANSYFFQGSVNIGLIHRGEGKCTLIDSGIDKDAGKRIMNILKEKDMIIDSIINTHSHADHIGGNAIIQEKTGAEIYATPLESAIIENPILEPLYLFSGSPPEFLKNKFFMAKDSKVKEKIYQNELNIKGTIFRIIPLPGHSLEHIGIVSPDGVLYAGDAYFSQRILEKHGFPFFQDIGETIKTLKKLKNTSYPYNVPSHGELEKKIETTIDFNREAIKKVIVFLMDCLKTPHSMEELCQKIFEKYSIKRTASQHYLTWSTLSAYISYLFNEGYIENKFYIHQLKWQIKKK